MEQTLSQQIGELLDRLEQAKADYNRDLEQIQQLDQLICDYLHALEFSRADYQERARIATAMQQCRYERRPYKDEVYRLEPLVRYLKSKNGNTLLNLLSHVHALAARTELAVEHKAYRPRVMDQAEYDNMVIVMESLTLHDPLNRDDTDNK